MAIDLSNKRFLIIDDFGDMRTMIRHMIESYGATEIDMASNGKEAVRLMTRHRYDIVLCDYNLGEGQDGQQILEEARHRRLIGLAALFIMITAENTSQMVMGAVEYYPDDYLSKPFNKLVLKTRLERLLARKGDLTEIDLALDRRNISDAIAYCEMNAVEGAPNRDELMRIKCELCLQTGDSAAVRTVCEQMLADRRIPWALMGLGKAQFMEGRLAEARETFQSIIDENQNHTEAYDWLARVMVKLGDSKRAQELLSEAAVLSPKAIRRQMMLGEVAMNNGDYAVAERAYRKAVVLGRNSVHKTPENYVKQSQALGHTSERDALRVLREMRKEFPKDKVAQFSASLGEIDVYRKVGRDDDAATAFKEAVEAYQSLGEALPMGVELEMARACFMSGQEDMAVGIVSRIVGNHHDDPEMLTEVEAMFSSVGRESDGAQIVDRVREKIATLNNDGVRMAEEGRLDEAIELFQQALQDLPENKTINLNAAKVLLMHLRANGNNERYRALVREYLDRVNRTDPGNPVLQQLYRLRDELFKRDRRAG